MSEVTVIHKTDAIARKEYHDDAWDFIQEWIDGGCWIEDKLNPLSFSEKRLLVQYRNRTLKGHRIIKGEKYHRQFNSYDGDTYVWRAKKIFYELACRYDLFPEI